MNLQKIYRGDLRALVLWFGLRSRCKKNDASFCTAYLIAVSIPAELFLLFP